MKTRHKINIWRLLPIVLSAVRVGVAELADATADDSDDGARVTPAEAQAIAQAIAAEVAAAVAKELAA